MRTFLKVKTICSNLHRHRGNDFRSATVLGQSLLLTKFQLPSSIKKTADLLDACWICVLDGGKKRRECGGDDDDDDDVDDDDDDDDDDVDDDDDG